LRSLWETLISSAVVSDISHFLFQMPTAVFNYAVYIG
jgi:hypothetical protein